MCRDAPGRSIVGRSRFFWSHESFRISLMSRKVGRKVGRKNLWVGKSESRPTDFDRLSVKIASKTKYFFSFYLQIFAVTFSGLHPIFNPLKQSIKNWLQHTVADIGLYADLGTGRALLRPIFV